MALIPDATKALEAERAIIVRARDEANDRMKRIIYLSIIKGQAERASAQKLRGSLKREALIEGVELLQIRGPTKAKKSTQSDTELGWPAAKLKPP